MTKEEIAAEMAKRLDEQTYYGMPVSTYTAVAVRVMFEVAAEKISQCTE